MATFREIDERILALVDPDTGEIQDMEAFEALNLERDRKVESMALWILDIRDEQEAIKYEIRRLQARFAANERKEKQLREYTTAVLGGEKFRTARISVSYRSSEAVEISDEDAVRKFAMTDDRFEDILRYKEPEISKVEIKRLIGEGVRVPGAEIVSRVNTVIK